jgi:serine/threonine protein kinase
MTKPLTSPGRLVAGRYRLESQIGGGGMGTVWLAKDELLGRQVAIKQVLSPATVSPQEADQQRKRALREGRIAARLSHPHAISVYDVALESGQPWLVMEYLPSRSLAEVLNEDGSLRVGLVAQIGAQVADALAATHAAGIVHRDVKPANILIGRGGRIDGLVKITDFGISHASGDVTLTQTGQITGTPAYLSPEVAQGKEMTEASDVFSLGATLYTCLEGQPPFGMEDNALGMLHRVAGGQIMPPRRAGSLTQPLLRMLAAEPADRPSMAEVRDELAKLAAGRHGDTTTVLLARTELRSDGEGRNRTTAFDGDAGDAGPAAVAGAAAAGLGAAAREAPARPPTKTFPDPPRSDPPRSETAAQAAPVAAPAAVSPPVDRTPPPPAGERRRRRGGVWLAAAVVALLLAGLIVFLVTRPDDPAAPNDATATTSAATSSSAAGTTSESSAEETSASTTAGTTSASETAPATGTGPGQAANEFFALIPGNLSAAYDLTSPAFQSRFSYGSFSGFWDDFSSVRISNVEERDGSTAVLDITYVKTNGSSTTEHHQLTFTRSGDGRLLLEQDVAV